MAEKTESVTVEQQAVVETQAAEPKAEAEKAAGLVARVKSSLGEAQRSLQQLETGAQQALATLAARADASRSTVKELLTKLEGLELRPEAALGAVTRKVAEVQGVATKRVAEVQELARRQLEGLPVRLVEGAGIASQQQVRALQQEVAELSKKLDAALAAPKKAGKAEGRAA